MPTVDPPDCIRPFRRRACSSPEQPLLCRPARGCDELRPGLPAVGHHMLIVGAHGRDDVVVELLPVLPARRDLHRARASDRNRLQLLRSEDAADAAGRVAAVVEDGHAYEVLAGLADRADLRFGAHLLGYGRSRAINAAAPQMRRITELDGVVNDREVPRAGERSGCEDDLVGFVETLRAGRHFIPEHAIADAGSAENHAIFVRFYDPRPLLGTSRANVAE